MTAHPLNDLDLCRDQYRGPAFILLFSSKYNYKNVSLQPGQLQVLTNFRIHHNVVSGCDLIFLQSYMWPLYIKEHLEIYISCDMCGTTYRLHVALHVNFKQQ